jgi:hypothetical protein
MYPHAFFGFPDQFFDDLAYRLSDGYFRVTKLFDDDINQGQEVLIAWVDKLNDSFQYFKGDSDNFGVAIFEHLDETGQDGFDRPL